MKEKDISDQKELRWRRREEREEHMCEERESILIYSQI
jgi:hypothetical protein